MKKLSLFLLAIFLSVQFVTAQTQAEMDKMMKQAQEQMKKYGTDTSVNKMLKNLQDQQKQVSGAIKNKGTNNNATTNGYVYADPGAYANVDNWKFPAKNNEMLALLPKKILTKTELVIFLNETYAQLAKKLPGGISTSVQSIASKYNDNGSKMGDVAVAGWYSNYREESLLLVIKAAATNPDDGLLLNNCAAILNMGGIEQRAVPILKYLLQFNGGSGMVLNNLGQAYAGLGDTDTAMYYLGRSIKAEPANPEANNTAGQIEASKGNTAKAINYFEESIKASYSKPAELKLRKIKIGSNIVPLVRARIKLPEYFNQFKYKLPVQCTSTDNAAVAAEGYKAFHKMIEVQLTNYMIKLTQLQQKLLIGQAPFSDVKLKKDGFKSQPYSEFCSIMSRDVLKDFMDNLHQYDKKYISDYAAIENEYQAKFQIIKKGFDEREKAASKAGCCGEGNTSCCISDEEKCKAYNALANEYLPQYASLTEDWQQKSSNYFKRFFDEVVYWGYLTLHPLSDDYFRLQCFYPIVVQYLSAMDKVGITKIIRPCNFKPVTAIAADSNAIKEMECPLDIKIPFIVGKIELNCDKFSIKAGEGAVFGYEKNFKAHQSTLSVGIGVKLETEVKLGPLKAGVSAGASEIAFITFDGNNGFADAGLKNEAKISGGVTGVIKEELSFGSTLGINAGWDFNDGDFKRTLGPADEVQLNKNVKMYKPGN